MTALGNPKLLERVSSGLVAIRNLFSQFDSDMNNVITREEFKSVRLCKVVPQFLLLFKRTPQQASRQSDHAAVLEHAPFMASVSSWGVWVHAPVRLLSSGPWFLALSLDGQLLQCWCTVTFLDCLISGAAVTNAAVCRCVTIMILCSTTLMVGT